MKFKEWLKLQEVGTSTASVAGFSRMTLPMVRRGFLGPWGEEDPFFKKKKKKKKRLDEAYVPSIFYHATTPEIAEKILTQGWSLNVPSEKKLDAGDLGWGIYFWKNRNLLGTYGSVLLSAKIDSGDVLDLADEKDPRVIRFHKMLLYDVGDREATRTVDPWAKEREADKALKDKMVDHLRSKGMEFGDAFEKSLDYYKRMAGRRDDNLAFSNAKMIRRQMLRLGVKGVHSNGELVIYDPSIIQQTDIVHHPNRT